MTQGAYTSHRGSMTLPVVVKVSRMVRVTRRVVAAVADVATFLAPTVGCAHDPVQVGDEHICRRCYRMMR